MRFALIVAMAMLWSGCHKRVTEEAAPADAQTSTSVDAGAAAETAAPPEAQSGGTLHSGDFCSRDDQCPDGTVCEGCSDQDRRCIPGCRTDADCQPPETCKEVQCIRCPCPHLCGA